MSLFWFLAGWLLGGGLVLLEVYARFRSGRWTKVTASDERGTDD